MCMCVHIYVYIYYVWGGSQPLQLHWLQFLSYPAASSLHTEQMQIEVASSLCHLNIKMTRQSLTARLKQLSILLVLLEQFKRQI